MPEDLYADDAGGTPGAPDAGAPKGESAEPAKQSDDVEAVLPKSILVGKKFNVGDEVVLKITAIHDDQISVAYSHDETKEEGESEGQESEGAAMPGKMMAGAMTGGGGEYD
jgi:hypothetical protein